MLLREYLSWEKIEQKEFARRAGISVSALGNYINNRRFPNSSAINKMYIASEKKITFEDWSEQFSKK
jgi:transcriptional regulator with XRE-family HTH domain